MNAVGLSFYDCLGKNLKLNNSNIFKIKCKNVLHKKDNALFHWITEGVIKLKQE